MTLTTEEVAERVATLAAAVGESSNDLIGLAARIIRCERADIYQVAFDPEKAILNVQMAPAVEEIEVVISKRQIEEAS